MSKAAKLAIGAYIGVGIITFGHSAANAETLAECKERYKMADYDMCVPDTSLGFVTMGGLVAATLWPLYWSWEVQQ